MDIPMTGSALLRALETAQTAPEPPAGPVAPPSPWLDYSASAGSAPAYDPSYERAPSDPQAEAIRRIVAALRAAERERQVAREARIRQIVRDHVLLIKLLKMPTPQERPPVGECAPGKPLRFDYRGLKP